MTKEISIKEHLKKARVKAHETQRHNGHFLKMVEAKKLKHGLTQPKGAKLK